MTLEQSLVEELRTVADVRTPPPPAVAQLVATAMRERRRARLVRAAAATAVAAAAVLAVVLGSLVDDPESAPQPVKPSPSFYASGVPYLQDHTLYVDHRPQPGQWFDVQSWGDYTVALSVDQSATILYRGESVGQVDGLVQVVSLSFDGTKAAWILSDPDAGSAVVVVRDLPTGAELGRLPVAGFDSASGFSLTVRNDGTTYYDVNGRQERWKPGSDPVPTEQMPSSSPHHPAGFDGVDAPVRLSPDHLWGAWVTDSGSGHLAVSVQRPGDPASRFTMPVPTDLDLAPLVFWLTPTEITFAGPENVHCDIEGRACRALGTS